MSTPCNPTCQPVLIAGSWQAAASTESFRVTDPNENRPIPRDFPVSTWADVSAALDAAVAAYDRLRSTDPARIADFLDTYARLIDDAAASLVDAAHQETGLPRQPRLAEVELPRTTGQLRLAATAARSGSWTLPVIDTRNGIRSCYESLGPVAVFGPNNFPFAFGSASGGDFAAAIAAGNPVIAKANTSHPETTRLFADLAVAALAETSLPPATVQLIYRTSHADGERLVGDPRLGASGYTGSRRAGLALKAAADAAGKPIYLELSSVNPVVIAPSALAERLDALVDEFTHSALLGTGQFCTNPGLVLLVRGPASDAFIQAVGDRFAATAPGTLLSPSVNQLLERSIDTLVQAGARLLVGGEPVSGRCARTNTLLSVTGTQFLGDSAVFQTEAFGNASLIVVAEDIPQLIQVIASLEGSLTGSLYTASHANDDDYHHLARALTPRVGRLLNDKMPTGVAVSPAMNHGGPYPATGHPGFTAVGLPASIRRFAKLTCYDHVREPRLPRWLRDRNPTDSTWRCIDGDWSTADVP